LKEGDSTLLKRLFYRSCFDLKEIEMFELKAVKQKMIILAMMLS